MNPIQVLAVGIRLFVIWFLWYGLTQTSGTYFSARGADPDTSMLPFAIGAILLASICFLLWLFPTFLARKILPKQAEAASSAPVFEDWFSLGCSLLGVWALAKATGATGWSPPTKFISVADVFKTKAAFGGGPLILLITLLITMRYREKNPPNQPLNTDAPVSWHVRR
jgi:hypothetical protein